MQRDGRGVGRSTATATLKHATRAEPQPGKTTLTEQLGSVSAAARPPLFEHGGEWEKIPTGEYALDGGADEGTVARAGGEPATAQDQLDNVATTAIDRKGSGRAIDSAVRAPVEAQLGIDLGHARVHDDANAQHSARAMGARGFAHGGDVFLGAGESERDPAVMAHELTHVAQQTTSGRATPQRKVTVGATNSPAEAEADAVAAAVTSGAPPPASALLCDHHAAPGQMAVGDFLARLEPRVVSIANAELGALGSAVGCPYIVQAFAKYRAQPAAATLAVLQRWIPAARNATSIDQLQQLVLARVQHGVAHWRERGTLPADLAAAEPGLAAQAQAAAPSGAGSAQRMTLDGLESELGAGAAVDGGVADQVSRATGRDVSSARIHTGPVAARMAAEHGATAFAAGQNVVMGSGAPSAGTALGDALLAHELAHTAQQQDAAADPAARRKPIGEEEQAAEQDADRATAKATGTGAGMAEVMRTGLQLQRCADDAGKPAKQMDNARYQQIEQRLAALVAQKQGLVDGSGTGKMEDIDAEIDTLIAELRLDFGVRIDKGKILEAAVAKKEMRIVDGRIVVAPSGTEHYFGERMGFTVEVDHVPPGQTLQIGWRWRTPASASKYRFLSPGPESHEKSKAEHFELHTSFWALAPDAVVKAEGMEVLAQIFIGNTDTPTQEVSTGFIAMPAKPVGDLQVINAPKRVVQDAALDLQIGPFTPDHHSYAVDWYVDGKLAQEDAPNFHHTYATLGTHDVHAELYRVRRNFGIQEKKLEKKTPPVTLEVMTLEQYGKQSLDELESSPFKPKPVQLGEVVTSGAKSLEAIEHRIDQGGSQAPYWEDRKKAEKERLDKIKELAPEHATARPLPADPTQLEPGVSYTGPITAMLVMAAGGGGAQPLAMHVTIKETAGTYNARLIDATSKKVLKFDGSGTTALAAYAAAFDAWRSNNEYPTGGRVVHRFAPPGWANGDSFSTTTDWKKAKEWVDGIIMVGGIVVGALLLANPEPVVTKWLGAILMAAVVARSSVAIYERIRNGGDVLSSENILDAVAIVTSAFGVTGSALRSAGIKAVNPTTYRVGNWMIMGAVAADGGTFVYAASEAIAALQVIQANPELDDGAKSTEILRILSSLFLTGAMLIASNRDLVRNGLKPHDFVKSKLEPGAKPDLDVGARLDAEYELKKAGQWTKETSKLDDGALLDQVFTNRSRQELETNLAKRIGDKQAKAFADALGNDAFVALHTHLGDDLVAQLARDASPAKMKGLVEAFGAHGCGALVKQIGATGLRRLTVHLSAEQIKKLSDDLGNVALKNLTSGSKPLDGNTIAHLVKTHGAKTAKWAAETLQGDAVSSLLGAVKKDTLAGLQDVTAVDAKKTVDVFTAATVDQLVPPATGKHFKTERTHLGEQTARGLAEEKLKHTKADDFVAHAEELAASATTPPGGLRAESLIIDSNVAVGIQELMGGMAWADLQPHKKVGINFLRKRAGLPELSGDPPKGDLRSLIGDHDLRASNVTLGEISSKGMKPGNFELTIARDDQQYRNVLDLLAQEPAIGTKKGAADRAIVADALFGNGPGTPTLMTGDKDMFSRLYDRFGVGVEKPIKQKQRQKKPDAIAEKYASGFDCAIPDGTAAGTKRTIKVIPMK